MENATPGVTLADESDKKPEQIEREMEQTRESITEKEGGACPAIRSRNVSDRSGRSARQSL